MPDLCIDCGLCLTLCPKNAFRATTRPFAEIDKFKYKVALPSPVLFGQFPAGMTPAHVVKGLESLGFDAVWDFSVELGLVNRATLEYLEKWEGPYPLLSVSCPVIVRLVQVAYPSMIDQLIRIQPPRELAGRELKRTYSRKLGLDPDEVAAIYITPCQAKTISILQPAEEARSNLDGALGISDVYNDILASARTLGINENRANTNDVLRNADILRWSTSEGQSRILYRHRYMSVTGLSNVMQVFDDIEKQKLRNIEYLECHACWGGCASGNLTVDNTYIVLSKIRRLLDEIPESDPSVEAEVTRRYPDVDFSLKGPIKPRVVGKGTSDLKERVRRVRAGEAISKSLPDLDCGLCGAPTCKAFAGDVADGKARRVDCVLYSDERLQQLRETYLRRAADPD